MPWQQQRIRRSSFRKAWKNDNKFAKKSLPNINQAPRLRLVVASSEQETFELYIIDPNTIKEKFQSRLKEIGFLLARKITSAK